METFGVHAAVYHPNLVRKLREIANDLLLGKFRIRHNAGGTLHGFFQSGIQHIPRSAANRFRKCLVHHVVDSDHGLSCHLGRNDIVEKVGDFRLVPEVMPIGYGQKVGHQPIDIAGRFRPVGLHIFPQIGLEPLDLDLLILAGEKLQQKFVVRVHLGQSLNLPRFTIANSRHAAADQRQYIKCNVHSVFLLQNRWA